MTGAIAKKLSYDEMFNSTTMFYINGVCEEKIRADIETQTDDILVGLRTITSKESLKQYIIEHKDSLDRLTSVAEISEERFKRMVSMIRKDRGFVFGWAAFGGDRTVRLFGGEPLPLSGSVAVSGIAWGNGWLQYPTRLVFGSPDAD